MYQKPAMRVVMLQHQQHLLGGSNLRSLGSNLNENEDLTDDITYGGGNGGTVLLIYDSRARHTGSLSSFYAFFNKERTRCRIAELRFEN